MRRILPVACVAFTFAVGLSAQTTGSGSAQTSTPQESTSHKTHGSSAKSGGRAVTLTGCLREGDTPGTYQLTNVDMSSMGGKSGKGSKSHEGTATSGSASGAETGSQSAMGGTGNVDLVASSSVNLKEHVGHRVQVSGNWTKGGTSGTSGSSDTAMSGSGQDKPAGTGSSSGQSSAGQSGSMSGKGMNAHELSVKSLKHISDTCQ